MKIAFIATFPPEQCGIATFTQNLVNAVRKNLVPEKDSISVIAIQKDDELDYGHEVSMTIHQHEKEDYHSAADYINNSGFDCCIIQHEYGIFGGDAGVYILSLANRLRIPFIVTAHTVLKKPSVAQQSVMRLLAEQSAQVVAMTKKARQFLRDIYGIDSAKITIIEHGVPDKIEVDKEKVKESMGLKGKTVLMTFGLLGRNKGIETVIRSLPEVVAHHPEIIYLVQGNTHPGVLRHEGESYRDSLIQLAKDSGVADHVIFRKGFMSEEELFELLHSIDIYITPYLHEEQITSGTLSYALGAGAVVLSTPYWHAQELLAENRGMLFEFRDHTRLASLINSLLDNPPFMETLRNNANAYAHHLRWSNTSKRYVQLLKNIIKEKSVTSPGNRQIEFSEPGLKHIRKLTDNIGMYQHALYGLPNFHEGYCLDDNARALMAMVLAAEQGYENETVELAEVYLSFILFMQQENGWFHNFLSIERKILDEECSEDAFGRTVWALGQLLSSECFTGLHDAAREIFIRALPHAGKMKYLRGSANTIIGLSYFLQHNPIQEEGLVLLNNLVKEMVTAYDLHNKDGWSWFEETLTYDNGILPLALLHAYKITGEKRLLDIARQSTNFLTQELMGRDYLSLVGSNEWYTRGKTKSPYPQQAIDAMSMVLLFSKWSQLEPGSQYADLMIKCYQWFFFENDLGISLYDRVTQGCCDGLEDYGINRNQGAESTLAAFISHYAVRNINGPDEFKKDELHSIKIS